MGTTEPPALPAQPGDLVADKYRIERVLAQGGMGVVVVARHEQLDQRVAVKFLLPEVAGSLPAAARFLREAQAAARIQSEHVCRVFDVGTLPNGAPYMVMELLDGVDLSDELERRGTLPVPEAVAHVVQALDAIVEAHRRGIVHRDLKPSNLFLCRRDDGRVLVKVLDFGISKVEMPADAAPSLKLTSTQTLLGSPAYMSPEQVRSAKDVDARSDLWALGVILYESLAGGTLFSGSTLGEVFSKIREDPVPPLSTHRADVPAELDHIVARCLQRKPDDRFASAVELREALLSFLGRFQASLTAGTPLPSVSTRAPIASDAALARTGYDGGRPPMPPGPTGLAVIGDSAGGATAMPRASHPTVDAWAKSRAERSHGRVWAAAGLALLCGTVGAWALLARGNAAPVAPVPVPPAAVAGEPPSAVPPPTVVPGNAASAPEPVAPATASASAPVASASASASAAAVPRGTAGPARTAAPRPPNAKRPGGSLDDVLGNQH